VPHHGRPSWPQTGRYWPPRTGPALRIVDDLLGADIVGGDSSAVRSTEFRDALREADPTRRRGILVDHVTAQVVGAMGLASAQLLDPAAGFFQSGMDSLMSVTLQRALSDSLGETLPASVVFDYPTVEALSDYLATLIPEVADAAEDDSADEYDDFSDDELLKELSERLG
jgi:phthiocerol/phenolphthiocerol synthesis type-I polyketide synthase B